MIIYLQALESEEDRSRFETLYRLYRDMMFGVAFRLTENREDAEDALHEAFLSVLDNMDKLSDPSSVATRGFLVVITEHKALDLLQKRERSLPLEDPDQLPGVPVAIQEDVPLASAMARLPAQYRALLLLRYYHGFSVREIAKTLDRTPGAVQKQLTRAKQALREAMEKEGCTL